MYGIYYIYYIIVITSMMFYVDVQSLLVSPPGCFEFEIEAGNGTVLGSGKVLGQ